MIIKNARIYSSLFFVTDFRWKTGNIMLKNLSRVSVKSTSTDKLPKIIDVYNRVMSISASYMSIDHNNVDVISTGWLMATAAISKQDKIRIIKLHSFFRSWMDLHRQIITKQFRNIPATINETLRTQSTTVLIEVFGFIFGLASCTDLLSLKICFSRFELTNNRGIRIHLFYYPICSDRVFPLYVFIYFFNQFLSAPIKEKTFSHNSWIK